MGVRPQLNLFFDQGRILSLLAKLTEVYLKNLQA